MKKNFTFKVKFDDPESEEEEYMPLAEYYLSYADVIDCKVIGNIFDNTELPD